LGRDTPAVTAWPAPRSPIEASYPGGGSNGFDRRAARVHWHDGDRVSYGATFMLPSSFMKSIQSEVDLVRWDNFDHHPTDTDWGGVGIFASDHLARLLRFNARGNVVVLVGPFKLPVGKWFRLEVRQYLSDVDGDAVSEVYLDDELIGRSRWANTYGRPIDHLRAGLVAIGAEAQKNPLQLWYADPFATGVRADSFFHNVERY
jgi:hypothetical protein